MFLESYKSSRLLLSSRVTLSLHENHFEEFLNAELQISSITEAIAKELSRFRLLCLLGENYPIRLYAPSLFKSRPAFECQCNFGSLFVFFFFVPSVEYFVMFFVCTPLQCSEIVLRFSLCCYFR